MMVLEQISLGKDQRLMLVRIGQRIHILATSPGGVTDLGELSQQEAAELIQIQEDRPKAPDGFVQALHQVLEKKKRGGSGDGRMD